MGFTAPPPSRGHQLGLVPPSPRSDTDSTGASRLPKFISKIKNKILKTESLALPPSPPTPKHTKKDFYRQKTHHVGFSICTDLLTKKT